jgi:hypothetical protein
MLLLQLASLLIDVEASASSAHLSSVTLAGHVTVSRGSRSRRLSVTAPALVSILDTSKGVRSSSTLLLTAFDGHSRSDGGSTIGKSAWSKSINVAAKRSPTAT